MKKLNTQDVKQLKFNCLLYGESGKGKTFSALTLDPKKTLILSAESGLLPLSGKDFEVWVVETWTDLTDAHKLLLSPDNQKQFTTVFIDSLTELSEICKVHIVTNERPAVRGKIDKIYDDQMDLKDWGLHRDKMTRMVRSFRDLPFNIIFTCLETSEKDEKSGVVKFRPSVDGKKFGTSLPGYFDEIFRLVVKSNGNEGSERYFVTGQTEVTLAKDRSGKLDLTEEPDWIKVMGKIKAGFAKKQEVKK